VTLGHDPDTGRFAAAPRECEYCRSSLEGRRSHARYCSRACKRDAHRRRLRLAAMHEHPRCAVCSSAMRYKVGWQGPGVNLTARTCSRECALVRYRWFAAARGVSPGSVR
jgi:hypothetical protein